MCQIIITYNIERKIILQIHWENYELWGAYAPKPILLSCYRFVLSK